MNETADAVIIGGGVIGTSIAYHLAQRQFGSIVLLERDTLGGGSTGLSVASIDSLTLQPLAVELHAHSLAFFRRCEELLGDECGFVETGSIAYAGSEHKDVLLTAVQHMQAAGLEVQSLGLEELARLEPMADLEGVAAASFAPMAGYADPILTTQAFAGASRRVGVDIRQGVTVTSLQQKDGRICGVKTATGDIDARVVIVAAGAWSAELLCTAGIELDLQPVSHPVVCLRRPPDFGPPHHSLLDLTSGIYARPESSGLSLLGSIDLRVGYDPIDLVAGAGHVPDDYVLWTMERLVARYPSLEAGELCKGWAGIMTISPDWQPVIGGWPEIPELYCATGFSGQGFQISPAAGDLLTGLITGDDLATGLLAPFTPTRFADGRLLQTDQETQSYGLLG